jgi:putative inorganic carbon (HCO3(-)) transporter
MNAYQFRVFGAGAVMALLAFAVLAFGAVDLWALVTFEVAVFVVAAVFVVRIVQGALPLVWNPFYVPLGVAILWTAAQSRLGLSVYPYQTALEALKWFVYGLLFAIAAHVFTDPAIRRGFRLAVIWFGFALCVFGLIQRYTAPGFIYWSVRIVDGRVFGPFVNGNHFAALVELILPLALIKATERSEQSVIYAAVSLVLLASTVLTGSRAGTVLAAAETVVVLLVRAGSLSRTRQRDRRRAWVLAGGAMISLAAVAWLSTSSSGLREHFEEQQPYAVRWSVVQSTWRLFLARPWTGFGAGTFEHVYPSAAQFDLGLFWTHAHNDPLELAMEWGIAGPLVLVGILGLLVRRRWPVEIWLQVVLPAVTLLAHSLVDFPLQIPAVAAAWLLTLALLPASVSVRKTAPTAPVKGGRLQEVST